MVTLYNVLSADGYITRTDGSEDFIPDSLWPNTLSFFGNYDILVIGRKSYEAIQRYDKSLTTPFEALAIQKIVLTRNIHFVPKTGYGMAHSVEEVFSSNANILVSSGPVLNTFLLNHQLVDEIVFQTLPTSIGEGVKPFTVDVLPRLTLLTEVQAPYGIKTSTYAVRRA